VQETLRKYRKPMAAMMAHTPETDELAVVGSSAAEQLAQQARAPLTLARVLARLRQKLPEAAARYDAADAARRAAEVERTAAALKVRATVAPDCSPVAVKVRSTLRPPCLRGLCCYSAGGPA
jgi:hypothetical protein